VIGYGTRKISVLRTLLTLIALGVALALAGCGGGSEQSSDEQAIPRAVAADLAAKSEAIAAAYDSGDVCGAAELADDLKNALDDAIAGGEIPAAFQRELDENATELQSELKCPPAPEEEDHGENKGKDKGNKKGHDDTTTVGITIDTTTEEG
jgi:hypothetical protein